MVSDGLALILEAKYAYTNDIALASGCVDTSITSLDYKMKILEDLNIQLDIFTGGVSSSGRQRKRTERNMPDQN